MKVRLGFVSNSSSSSFIVEVSQDFKVTKSMANCTDVLKELWDNEEYVTEDEEEITEKGLKY